jgi:TRAP-type uncharacterized transport system substrate-binding protein
MPNSDAAKDHKPKATRKASFRLPLRVSTVSWRDLAETLLPVLVVSAVAVALALHYVRPAPPRTLTMSSGPAASTFAAVAEQYRRILARSGITLKIVPSRGSLENLERLRDPDSGVDIGLVQSGVAGSAAAGEVVSLGSVFYEPVTIFYRRDKPIERLSQLQGARIAVGAEGSGTRALSLQLLKANEIEPGGATRLLDLEGEAARKALLERTADAIVLTGDSASTATLRELLHAPGVRLYDFTQGDAYVRRFRFLSKLDVPAGAFDLGANLPATATTLLAPTVELLAHAGLHPALSDLLIEAATEVHGRATLFQNANQFPAPLVHDFPISPDATRFYKSGKSFAYRYLPFWLASLLDRALVVLLPIVVVVIPGLRYLPQLYGWRIDSRIHRHYGELMALEREALGELSADKRAALVERLAQIEKSVIARKMPGSHAEQIYVLRQHIGFVRERLAASRRAAAPRAAAHAAGP